MAQIYATLIRKGLKTIDDVPKNLKKAVQKILDEDKEQPMLLNIILKTILRKEVKAMAVIYATLIVKGKKTINDVPMVIREQVKQILIDLDLPELAE